MRKHQTMDEILASVSLLASFMTGKSFTLSNQLYLNGKKRAQIKFPFQTRLSKRISILLLLIITLISTAKITPRKYCFL